MRRLVARARAAARRRRARYRRWARTLWRQGGGYVWRELAFARAARRTAGGPRLDLCIAHDVFALRAGRAIAGRTGARLVYDAVEIPVLEERTGPAYRDLSPAIRRVLNGGHARIIQRADAVMTVGPSLRDWLGKRFPEVTPISVVRNVRDEDGAVTASSEIRTDLGLGPADRLVLHLNAVVPGSGIETLIDATTRLPGNVHVALLGRVGGTVGGPDGARVPYPQALLELAGAKEVGDRFHLLPVKPVDQLAAYAAGADIGAILLRPTAMNVRLSLPNRIFDLFAAGLPVASSDIRDIRLLIEHYDAGRIYDPDSPQDIARTILGMLAPGTLPALKANAAQAARELTWKRERQRFLELVGDGLGVPERGRVCIVAYKDLSQNQRVARLSRALVETGRDVQVLSRARPNGALAVPGVEYRLLHRIARSAEQIAESAAAREA
jgi:glycosyltransferase involved in cell wall biosynthesis